MNRKHASRRAASLTAVATAVATVAVGSSPAAADPYATTVVSSTGYPATPGLYTDPSAALGKPTTSFVDSFENQTYRTSVVGAAFGNTPAGGPTVATVSAGQSIVVGFDHDVFDDPANPYGVDLLVFGNAFFAASGAVTPTTDPRTISITSGALAEGLTVSVAQSPTGPWYTYSGRTGDGMFPTQADRWNAAAGAYGPESDFTKPVNPALTNASFLNKTVDQAIGLYDGSGGGAGFDLAESGFAWVRYVQFTGTGGEIDAVSDVAPAVPEPGTAGIAGVLVTAGLLARKQRRPLQY